MDKPPGQRPLTGSAEQAARYRARKAAAASTDGPPSHVWHTYGTEPLPSRAEALALPLRAFPGWFLCIQCERCGETRMVHEAQTPWQDVRLVYVLRRFIASVFLGLGVWLVYVLRRLQHAGCGGEAASVGLHSGITGVPSHRVRRIVLRGG